MSSGFSPAGTSPGTPDLFNMVSQSHGRPRGGGPLLPSKVSSSKRVEEIHQVSLFLVGEPHVETDIVENHGVTQRPGRTVVKIGSMRGKRPHARNLDFADILPFASDQRAARIRSLDDLSGCGVAKRDHGQVTEVEGAAGVRSP